MNLRQLEAFRTVLSAGSVTKAAELMRISQPAVSQLLIQFEERTGVSLFVRENQRLHPTQEALTLLLEVENTFASLNRVAHVAAALRQHRLGAIHVAGCPAIARTVLPRIVSHYCQAKPQIQVHLESMRSRSMIEAVLTNQVDIGISHIPADRAEIESVHLISLNAVCVMPQDHHLTNKSVIRAQDLAGERFVSLGPNERARIVLDKIFGDLQILRDIQVETGQSDSACALVASGSGVTIVDPLSAHENRNLGITSRPFKPDVEFDFWLIRSRNSPRSALYDDFAAAISHDLKMLRYE